LGEAERKVRVTKAEARKRVMQRPMVLGLAGMMAATSCEGGESRRGVVLIEMERGIPFLDDARCCARDEWRRMTCLPYFVEVQARYEVIEYI
jgi:hypothetical protein